jgi:hypothetical protein
MPAPLRAIPARLFIVVNEEEIFEYNGETRFELERSSFVASAKVDVTRRSVLETT